MFNKALETNELFSLFHILLLDTDYPFLIEKIPIDCVGMLLCIHLSVLHMNRKIFYRFQKFVMTPRRSVYHDSMPLSGQIANIANGFVHLLILHMNQKITYRSQRFVMIPTIFISKQICFSSPNICRQNFTFHRRSSEVNAFTAFDCKATLCTGQQSRRFPFGYQTNVESGVFHVQVERCASL